MLSFEVNKFLTLRLQAGKVIIYVDSEEFTQCKSLLLSIPDNLFEEVKSIDEAAEIFKTSEQEQRLVKDKLTPEVKFWAHCSNLQAWYENNYDTRLLHRDLSFPLLKRLTEVGDLLARRVFKDEIVKRLEGSFPSVVNYLIIEGYLNYFIEEEIVQLLRDVDLLKTLVMIGNKDNFNALQILLILVRNYKNFYLKGLLKALIQYDNPNLFDSLDQFGLIYSNFSDNELATLLLNSDEATRVLKLHSIVCQIVYRNEEGRITYSLNRNNNIASVIVSNKQVVGLFLGYRKLKNFPRQILEFSELEVLSLSGNFIKSIPLSINKLIHLKKLMLSSNKLQLLPPTIGDLSCLQILFLDNNFLSSIPSSIGKLSNLEELDLSINKLRYLPNSIGDLFKLKKLSIIKNSLSSIPKTIVKLINLEEISLFNNDISEKTFLCFKKLLIENNPNILFH